MATQSSSPALLKLEQQRLELARDENDLRIAATAHALGATLVSRELAVRARPGSQAQEKGAPLPVGLWRTNQPAWESG